MLTVEEAIYHIQQLLPKHLHDEYVLFFGDIHRQHLLLQEVLYEISHMGKRYERMFDQVYVTIPEMGTERAPIHGYKWRLRSGSLSNYCDFCLQADTCATCGEFMSASNYTSRICECIHPSKMGKLLECDDRL